MLNSQLNTCDTTFSIMSNIVFINSNFESCLKKLENSKAPTATKTNQQQEDPRKCGAGSKEHGGSGSLGNGLVL